MIENIENYKTVIDGAAYLFREEIIAIFNHAQTHITDRPKYLHIYEKQFFTHLKPIYIEYQISAPIVDNHFFKNDHANQQILFNLYSQDKIYWFYKNLVLNNEFIQFPKHLWDHPMAKFISSTQLPVDLQNYLILI